ncbi:MAG: HAD family hydrolase [Bacillota bacterium]
MIKLVLCDIDGTLIHPGEREVSPKVLEQVERLQRKGLLFCPASGRQYNSLRGLFTTIADRIYYISNNGAVVLGPDKGGPLEEQIISKTALPRELALRICEYILASDDFELVIGGENTEYLVPKKINLTAHFEAMHYKVVTVERPEAVPEDIVKVTAFCEAGVLEHYRALKAVWGNDCDVAVSGKRWIDFTLSNKGVGVKNLCAALEIPYKNVMAIGDNFNDLEMLDMVGYPVVMESAIEEIRSRSSVRCKKVEDVLAEL